jgi:hypothetical protein
MADISTLQDDFAGTLVKWPGTYGGVAIVSEQASIPCTTGYPALSTEGVNYNVANSSVYAKITPPANGNGGREAYMELIMAGNNKISMFWANGALGARITVAGTNTLLGQIGYSATSHAWWRFNSTGANNIRFSTSSDGIGWGELLSHTTPFALSAMYLAFTSGYWGSESAANMLVDNVNTLTALTPGTSGVSGWGSISIGG